MADAALTRMDTYLTFTLDQEVFAVAVGHVREVLELAPITRVPRTPAFMRGVINLRGSVVPVVDMRLKFGLPAEKDTVDSCIIVLEVLVDGEKLVIGALADSVKEVFELGGENIEPPPRIGTRMNTEFIKGMANHEGRFVIILDIDRVFSAEELNLVQGTSGKVNEALPGEPPERPGAPEGNVGGR